ncbi:MAG TPA: tetratricopeptide repeat protein [Bryobacteraceae bacterium]|nr:tetratricopeptide repeat protein [Bryobacteraceae bacterium]
MVKSELVRNELEKILASERFARNERLRGFLRFVVEEELSGRGDQVKECLIGSAVFGRKPDYDVHQDSIVRTEAVKLRARLMEYYITAGAADPVLIEIPKGGYKPLFRPVARPLEAPRESTTPPDVRQAPRQRRRWLPLPSRVSLAGATGALLLTLAAGSWYALARRSAPIPIAVLPLLNLNGNPADNYYADGLTGEIIRNLSIIDGLAVRSQTSSFGLKGQFRNVHDAGHQLKADYILEGSVLRAGPQLRIDVQLVRVSDDFPLWSGRFDRLVSDIFAIQDDISVGVVNNLRLKLGRGRRRYETNEEAYDLYLHARSLPQRARNAALEAASVYKQVMGKDPSFAPAYAGLASAYAASSAQGFGNDHAEELIAMRSAAEKAIHLDPLLAEAHAALGMVYAREGQWVQSEQSYRRSIELDPNNPQTHSDFSMWLLWPLGRINEAVREMRIAEKADPLSALIELRLGLTLIAAGRYEEAAVHCAGSPECLGQARLAQGRIDEAIPILSTLENPRYLGYAYGRAGRREEAEKLAIAVAPNAFSQALIFAGLGDKDRTFQALDRVAELGGIRIGRALNSPEFALLRNDPRAKALRKRVGLPY